MKKRRSDNMDKLCIGDQLQIQCYKHNGKVHRAWNEAVLLDEKKDYMVFGNNNWAGIRTRSKYRYHQTGAGNPIRRRSGY